MLDGDDDDDDTDAGVGPALTAAVSDDVVQKQVHFSGFTA